MRFLRDMDRDGHISPERVSEVLESWEPASRLTAQKIINQYGYPAMVSTTQMAWSNTPPFKRTVVHSPSYVHRFPTTHADVLEQTIDYTIPTDLIPSVLSFNGSVSYNRTRGELSVICGTQEMNLMALNLVHEIVQGRKTVDEARSDFATSVSNIADGKVAELARELVFTPMGSRTADADSPFVEGERQAQEARKTVPSVRR